jgi:hypothetical protein
MKIKISREFSFDTEFQEYICLITLFLPADQNENLIKELRNKKRSVLFEFLTKHFGTYQDGYRYTSWRVYGSTFEQVLDESERLIQESIATIEQVYKINTDNIKSLPEPITEYYNID